MSQRMLSRLILANLNVITSSSDYSDYAGHRPGVTAAMQIHSRYTVDRE